MKKESLNIPKDFEQKVNGGLLNTDLEVGAILYKDFGKERWEFIRSNDSSVIRKEDGFMTRDEALEAYNVQVEKYHKKNNIDDFEENEHSGLSLGR